MLIHQPRKIFILLVSGALLLCPVSSFALSEVALEAVDLSGNAPPFLEAEQVRSDLQVTHWLLKHNYGRYLLLQENGTDWEGVFRKLEEELINSANPPLTHHFLKRLMEALSFTEDPQLRGDLLLGNRHYLHQVEPKAAFYSGIQLVLQEGRHRVQPNLDFPEIADHFLLKCRPKLEQLFPVIGDRIEEQRFMLGMLGTLKPSPLDCVFENELGISGNLQFGLSLNRGTRNRPEGPLFRVIEGHIPYVLWYRNGRDGERASSNFFKAARKLRRYRTLVLDVRGNHNGSFRFIEKWLRELTSKNWENVIVREKQTIPMLRGLLNRTQWDLRFSSNPLVSREMLEQRRLQLRALLEHFQENEIAEKWIETKFLFKGNPEAPEWNKRLIVVANEHCGDGCQFLAALARQEPDSYLIGSMTGPFPSGFTVPLFQLPHSRILLSINQRLHLDHEETPVAPSGYQPDYWLFPEMGIQDVLRFAGSL